MEYLYGLLFGTEPKQQSDADARHALHAKLEALPDRDNTNLTLTAAELRILKEATTTTRQNGGGDESSKDASNLTEDLDPSTADAVVGAYGASPLNRTRLQTKAGSPRSPAAAQGVQNAVADLISERQLVERPQGAPEDARGGVVGGQRLGL